MIDNIKRERLRAMIQRGDMAMAYHRYQQKGGTQHISCMWKFLNGVKPFKRDGWKMYAAIMEVVDERIQKDAAPHKAMRDLEQRLAL